MEHLRSICIVVETLSSCNEGFLLGALALGAVLLLLRLHRPKYSYYSAPSPPLRAPYWLFGNVEMIERCGRPPKCSSHMQLFPSSCMCYHYR